MSEHDLHPDSDPEMAHALEHGRGVPAPGFLRGLRGHLIDNDPGYGPRPAGLPWIVFGYAVAGLVLMAIGVLQAGAWL